MKTKYIIYCRVTSIVCHVMKSFDRLREEPRIQTMLFGFIDKSAIAYLFIIHIAQESLLTTPYKEEFVQNSRTGIGVWR